MSPHGKVIAIQGYWFLVNKNKNNKSDHDEWRQHPKHVPIIKKDTPGDFCAQH
jgi:hypothetical protein